MNQACIRILNKINKDKNYKIIIAEDKENHNIIGTQHYL